MTDAKMTDAIADAPAVKEADPAPDAPAVVADDTVADVTPAEPAAPAPDASGEVWICIRTADGRYPPPLREQVPVFQEWFTAQLKMAEDARLAERVWSAPQRQSGNGARHDGNGDASEIEIGR